MDGMGTVRIIGNVIAAALHLPRIVMPRDIPVHAAQALAAAEQVPPAGRT